MVNRVVGVLVAKHVTDVDHSTAMEYTSSDEEEPRPVVPLNYMRRNPRKDPKIHLPKPATGRALRDAASALWEMAHADEGDELFTVKFNGKGRLGMHFVPDKMPLTLRQVDDDGLVSLLEPRVTAGVTLQAVDGDSLDGYGSYDSAMDVLRAADRPMQITFSRPEAELRREHREKRAEKFLRHAAYKCNVSMAKEMLGKHGADVDGTDVDGYSPLLVAARWGKTAMSMELIMLGADVHVRTNIGDSAYNLAVDNEHHKLAAQLARSGCSTAVNQDLVRRDEAAKEWIALALQPRLARPAASDSMGRSADGELREAEEELIEEMEGATPAELRKWARAAGLTAGEMRGCHQPAVKAQLISLDLEREEVATGHKESSSATLPPAPRSFGSAANVELHLRPAPEEETYESPNGPEGKSPRAVRGLAEEEITFRVGQRLDKMVPWTCDMIVGPDGMELFCGKRRIEEWSYDEVAAVSTVGNAKANSGELHILLDGGVRPVEFDTLNCEDMCRLIRSHLNSGDAEQSIVEEGIPEGRPSRSRRPVTDDLSDLVSAIPEGVPVTVVQLKGHPFEPEPEPEPESYEHSMGESRDGSTRRSQSMPASSRSRQRQLLRNPNSDEPSELQLNERRVTPDEMGLERPTKPVLVFGTQDGGEAEHVLLHRSSASLEDLIQKQIREVEEEMQGTKKSKRSFRGLRGVKGRKDGANSPRGAVAVAH